MAPQGYGLDLSKLIILIIFDPFWVWWPNGNILTSIVSNSHFGKRPGTRDMTISGPNVGPHFSHNTGYLGAHRGI